MCLGDGTRVVKDPGGFEGRPRSRNLFVEGSKQRRRGGCCRRYGDYLQKGEGRLGYVVAVALAA